MRPKKSLGQNFLKSKQAIVDMIRAAQISAGERVLEIGPGKGVLTEALLEAGAKVIAVEADGELIPILREKFAAEIKSGQLLIINEDILEFSPKKDVYKVVANIPYYITGAIFRKFLQSKSQPISMTILVQKEVAERIVARDKKESILSISVKAYGEPKIISKVSKRYFTPEPKVDSAIIHVDSINKAHFKEISEKNFFELVKTAFAQKRKTLVNNLSKLKIDGLPEILSNLGLNPKARAEDLSLKSFLALTKAVFPQRYKSPKAK